jgi:signal transduction histidine kinase
MRGQLLTRTAERERALEEANTAIHVRDEFVSIAAHELKTPVTVLRGYAQLLLSRAEHAEPTDLTRLGQILRRIDSQSRKLARLTEQLLDVTRLERGTFKLAAVRFDLNAMLRDIAEGSPHQSRLRLHLSNEPQFVHADPLRTEQVLLNLIDNAAKFSPEDAPIEFSIESSVPGGARVTVRDYGVGIPPEHREQIFERFHQAHAESHQSGLGLGLYIAKQIVDLHGGTIRVDFPAGGGARFTVDLPTAVLDPEHAAHGSLVRGTGHLH